MNFIEAIKSVFSKYATFSGRARRSEYWYYTLFYYVLVYGITLLDFIPGFATLVGILSLILLVPSLAVMTRRLHDVGKSGWLVVINYALECIPVVLVIASIGIDHFIKLNNSNFEAIAHTMDVNLLIASLVCGLVSFVYSIYLLFLTVKDSQYGENKYGPNPKGLNGINNF